MVARRTQEMAGIFVSFLIIICGIFAWLWQRTEQAEERYHQAMVFKQEQMKKTEELTKALHISEMNSKELQAAYEELKHRPPVASFTVQTPKLAVATEQVAEWINKQDISLPPAALEKTDRTAVVKNDQDYKVDVLKINLDKAWEFSLGVGIHLGDVYLPVGVQRNYAAHKAVAVEVHLVPSELVKGKIKTSGWEVKHVWWY